MNNKYKIKPFGLFYVVEKEVTIDCGFFFIKPKIEWLKLSFNGVPVHSFLSNHPCLFKTKGQAKKFIKNLEEEIEYIN